MRSRISSLCLLSAFALSVVGCTTETTTTTTPTATSTATSAPGDAAKKPAIKSANKKPKELTKSTGPTQLTE